MRRGAVGRELSRATSGVIEMLESRTLLDGIVTSLADSNSAGTLRSAIVAANNNPGPDTITFAASLTADGPKEIKLLLGQMTLTDTGGKTTITGPGASLLSINGNSASRLFRISSGVAVEISGLTLTGGKALGTDDGGDGGAIYTEGPLTLTNSTLAGNIATHSGGGLFNTGAALTITGSTFSANTAQTGDGGGVSITGSVQINTSTFSGNSGIHGGGISLDGDFIKILTLTSSTLSGNTATGGGGIFSTGALVVFGSTFSGNTVTYGGTLANNQDGQHGFGSGGCRHR